MSAKKPKKEYTPEQREMFARRGRKSNRKGKTYERDVCKVANPYMVELGWEWARTPQSGGSWQASRFAHLRGERADLRVPAACPIFPECKNREGWAFEQLFNKGGFDNWAPVQWFVEAFEKAYAAEKALVLIFTRNLQPDFVMLGARDYLEVTTADVKEDRIMRVGDFVILLLTDFMAAFVSRQKEDRDLEVANEGGDGQAQAHRE